MYKPAIHLDYRHHLDWKDRPIQHIWEELIDLRRKISEVIRHRWGDPHFYIENIHGVPVLSFIALEEFFSFWLVRNGRAIGDISLFDDRNIRMLSDWIKKASAGLTRCNECGEWAKESICYSFAGAVCPKCYNPEKHLPPDTRGD